MIETICYGKKELWEHRDDAKQYFFAAINGCDPASSECERYTKIYMELLQGKCLCTDSEEKQTEKGMTANGQIQLFKTG